MLMRVMRSPPPTFAPFQISTPLDFLFQTSANFVFPERKKVGQSDGRNFISNFIIVIIIIIPSRPHKPE